MQRQATDWENTCLQIYISLKKTCIWNKKEQKFEQMKIYKRRYVSGQLSYEKIFNIINQGNAN